MSSQNKLQLDAEERAILIAYRDGRLVRAADADEKIQGLRSAAANRLKSERINIRLTPSDLLALKQGAAREGLPYETLISSVLHKYATGQL